MKKYCLNKLLFVLLSILIAPIAYSAAPLWTFNPLTPTTVAISAGGSATVMYRVTNQSRRTHTLVMNTIPGISQITTAGNCPNPFILQYQQSCILNLLISDSTLKGNVTNGPIVCQQGNSMQCYQPSAANSLKITKTVTDFTVGGSVFGLQGVLVLQNNGSDDLTMSADGSFTFSQALPSGSPYSVTIQTQPLNQTCTVSNGTGVISTTNVNNIIVNCSANARTVGGNVTGLSGTVVLQNNGSDNLNINADGPFTFSIPLAPGASYNVTVLTQPNAQTCTVVNGSGTVGASDVTNVQVTCATNAYTVGGNVSGLSGTVVLQNNGTDNLNINNDGSFTFSVPIAEGATYNVTIFIQPIGQTCIVSNGSGTMGAANVTNVGVSCVTNTTSLTISVVDLALSVTNPGLNPALTGNPRFITITNTGSFTATNLIINFPVWPLNTTAITTCGNSLASGNSCTVTITPGDTSTSDGSNPCASGTGTAPVPGVVQVAADNSNTVSSNVVILSYGCIYQGGYLFAVDDTTATSGSIGGKVAATADDNSNVWSTVFTDTFANSITDGQANTNMLTIPAAVYRAAQTCLDKTDQGFSDWYLPAICEFGYDPAGAGSGCGTLIAPLIQNIQSNLVNNGYGNFLNNLYWSSTEISTVDVWIERVINGDQAISQKDSIVPIRCTRLF